MVKKYYALVGHCKMAPGLQLGVSVFDYDPETAVMTHIGDYDRGLKVGAQTYDPKKNKVYVVDEFWSLEGRTGGGGHVASFNLNKETGTLTRTSIQRTFGTNPSYLTVDKTGKYLLVTHHCTEHFVTRLVKTEGGYDAVVAYDLCTLLLYRLEENGDIGPILDVFEIHGRDVEGGLKFPHLHCVVPDREKNYYIVCDKGLDKVYSFKIDYGREKIVKCCEVACVPGSEPRYCAFHPTELVFYCNHESSTEIRAYRLEKNGSFRLVGSCASIPEDMADAVSPSDIVVHPNGKYILTSLRQKDLISVLEIQEDGGLTRLQTISCGGVNPRGLCVSPDGRFLLTANMQTETVNVFSIGENGLLTPVSAVHTGGFPGNVQIVGVSAGE